MLDRPTLEPEPEAMRMHQMGLYFGTKPPGGDFDQTTIQNKLNDFGVPKLVLEVASADDEDEFLRAIRLAVSLLNGGNTLVQQSFLSEFEGRQSEAFFQKMTQRLRKWHGEIDVGVLNYRNFERKKSELIFKNLRGVDISPEVNRSVTWVFRFLQLLCENHNLQSQHSLRKHGLVQLTLEFVDAVFGSVTSNSELSSILASKAKSELANQTLISLTEYCQGPCSENQLAIAIHESHGLDVCVSILLQEQTNKSEVALTLKNNATKFLLATLESHYHTEVIQRILYNIDQPQQLIRVLKSVYAIHSTENPKVTEAAIADAEEVGHNIYILVQTLAAHSPAIAKVLKDEKNPSLEFYGGGTA